mmetsp:Transcript_6385/g.13800  ORF Transcript_6385/g.13800 Transcript_6385/m.13800 type:complete len:322 (+) Transcript_6385:926-1891(+)
MYHGGRLSRHSLVGRGERRNAAAAQLPRRTGMSRLLSPGHRAPRTESQNLPNLFLRRAHGNTADEQDRAAGNERTRRAGGRNLRPQLRGTAPSHHRGHPRRRTLRHGRRRRRPRTLLLRHRPRRRRRPLRRRRGRGTPAGPRCPPLSLAGPLRRRGRRGQPRRHSLEGRHHRRARAGGVRESRKRGGTQRAPGGDRGRGERRPGETGKEGAQRTTLQGDAGNRNEVSRLRPLRQMYLYRRRQGERLRVLLRHACTASGCGGGSGGMSQRGGGSGGIRGRAQCSRGTGPSAHSFRVWYLRALSYSSGLLRISQCTGALQRRV